MSFHAPGTDGRCVGCQVKLAECHPYLSSWFWNQVIPKYPDTHVAWGWRDQQDQDVFFAAGKSELQWPDSAHNKTDDQGNPESKAVDLFRQDSLGKGHWERDWFAKIAADVDYYGLPMRCGIKFQTLGDADHFEYTAT